MNEDRDMVKLWVALPWEEHCSCPAATQVAMMVALKVDLVVHSPFRALAAWLQVRTWHVHAPMQQGP